ncbi:MAG: HPF/RaiA family ribosome-associated protein [Patescibacteria group bacterium]
MEIRIRTKNMELTNHLEKYIQGKITKVEKFLPKFIAKEEKDKEKVEDPKARINMEIEIEKITKGQNKGDVHRVEAQMFLPGTSLRAENTSTSPKEAVAEVKEELQRQVKEYKDKQATLQRKGERKAKEIREKSGTEMKDEEGKYADEA